MERRLNSPTKVNTYHKKNTICVCKSTCGNFFKSKEIWIFSEGCKDRNAKSIGTSLDLWRVPGNLLVNPNTENIYLHVSFNHKKVVSKNLSIIIYDKLICFFYIEAVNVFDQAALI